MRRTDLRRRRWKKTVAGDGLYMLIHVQFSVQEKFKKFKKIPRSRTTPNGFMTSAPMYRFRSTYNAFSKPGTYLKRSSNGVTVRPSSCSEAGSRGSRKRTSERAAKDGVRKRESRPSRRRSRIEHRNGTGDGVVRRSLRTKCTSSCCCHHWMHIREHVTYSCMNMSHFCEHVTYDELVIKKNIRVDSRCVIDVLHGRHSHLAPTLLLVVRQGVATSER